MNKSEQKPHRTQASGASQLEQLTEMGQTIFHAKRAGRLPGLPLGYTKQMDYLVTVVLPKRLRNFSTRPPMLSTDFCVPV